MISTSAPRPSSSSTAAIVSLSVAIFSLSASAETVAHWHFDEGPADSAVEHPQLDVVLDSSGNGNHLRTWADFTAPAYTADTPFDSIPLTGEPNHYALSFLHGNRDIYTEDKPINTHAFENLTIEASFKLENDRAFQVIVGKDGNPIEGAPPVALKLTDAGYLEFLMVDGANEFLYVHSEEPLEAGVWYSAAATADGNEMALWLKRPGEAEYRLQATEPIEGMFAIEDDIWTVGRGMWQGNFTDFFDGLIDQVRVSGAILEPDEFLGADPDPTAGQGTLLELSSLNSAHASPLSAPESSPLRIDSY